MIVASAPLRISLLGGGSDHPGHYREHGGAVLGTAIDRHAVVGRGRGSATSLRMSLRGMGLGASSAEIVATLAALHARDGRRPAPSFLADEAARMEHSLTDGRSGHQDAWLSAMGGVRLVEFMPDGTAIPARVSEPPGGWSGLEERMLVVSVGPRPLGSDAAGDQAVRVRRPENAKALSELAELAREGAGALSGGRWGDLGAMVSESWRLKRSLAPSVATERADLALEIAISKGALGGKLLGAGGGGYVLILVEPGLRDRVRGALGSPPELKAGIDCGGVEVNVDG